MKITINKKAKEIELDVRETNLFTRFTGLMFRSKETRSLFFYFANDKRWSIHSLFVFFPFLAIWLNEKNEVIDLRRVEPFELMIKPKNEFRKLIEIPFNENNREIIRFFVGKGEKFK